MMRSLVRDPLPLARGLLALLLVCTWLAPLLTHADGHEHAICPEHGELVHVPRDGAPRQSDAPGLRSAPTRAEALAHEHCPVIWRACDAPQYAPGHEATPLVIGDAIRNPGCTLNTTPLLRLAPKQSPPV